MTIKAVLLKISRWFSSRPKEVIPRQEDVKQQSESELAEQEKEQRLKNDKGNVKSSIKA